MNKADRSIETLFRDMDKLQDRMFERLRQLRGTLRFRQHMEDHLMDSLIEIAACGGDAGEIAAEALIVAWPSAGWHDNMNVMLTNYARKISPEEWQERKAAGDLNWPHLHQGLEGWIASCDPPDTVEMEVRPEGGD